MTKAAIVGRARRIGLRLPIPPTVKKERDRAGDAIPASLWPPTPLERVVAEPPRFAKRIEIVPEPEGIAGIYLLNASEFDCRAPTGDEPTEKHLLRVCGEPATEGGYCKPCRSRLYTKVEATGLAFILENWVK